MDVSSVCEIIILTNLKIARTIKSCEAIYTTGKGECQGDFLKNSFFFGKSPECSCFLANALAFSLSFFGEDENNAKADGACPPLRGRL